LPSVSNSDTFRSFTGTESITKKIFPDIAMHFIPRTKNAITGIGCIVLSMGLVMILYWILYLFRQMPIGDIPILSESITALLALMTGYGLIRRKRWAVPCCLVLSGMWAYGVIGGIALDLQHGLSFDSPFGAITDAVMFPLILFFALWLAVTIWNNREQFGKTA
jgi:hypothetical protein